MKKSLKIILENGEEIESYVGVSVREVMKLINEPDVIALRVNGIITHFDTELTENAYISFIKINDRIGSKIYKKGLQFVYINAVKDLYGDKATVVIKHSLDKALYTEIKMKKHLDKIMVKTIKAKMQETILRDLEFKRVQVSRHDALEYSLSKGEDEKVLNYSFMTDDTVTLYELDDEYNYFYYLMPASTKILKDFDLTYVEPNGVILSYPIDGKVPKYSPSPLVFNAFNVNEEKLNSLGVSYSGNINKILSDGKIRDYIQLNEILYDENLNNIAEKVRKNKNIKALFISGPSSSGKTTTSKKLAMYLRSKGLSTFVISTDDYFVNRVDNPKKADGSYEYEIVEALDIKLFNSHIKSLLSGKKVVLPTYNFITGEKEFKGSPVTLEKNQILIVEGLHAVNEKLSSSISKKNKLKIYISPFTPIGLDRHNHMSTTDIRLLRRMVRDYMHRGYSAKATLENWLSMRASERDYVYPYQREVDIVVNTSLSYEIGVIRTYVEPLLYSIEKDDPNYEEAIRILNFLKSFLNIPSEFVPQTSVLREFIGNSYFE